MAILGFLVHTVEDASPAVENSMKQFEEITTYGIHEDCYVVAVADTPQPELEALLERVKALDGVITCYVTSLSLEDELQE